MDAKPARAFTRDEPIVLETTEGLPHRSAADAQARGQFVGVQARSGFESYGKDLFLDELVRRLLGICIDCGE